MTVNGKTRIILSGLIYPISMMRMFWEELERRDNVELTTVGPFFDDYIPWKGGIRLPRMYVKMPTVPLSQDMAKYHVHPQMLVDVLPDDVDIFIQVDAGFHFASRPNAKKVVLVETDPHVLKKHYTAPASYSDVVFCMQSNYVVGDDIWLPYAVDNHWFYPEKSELKYDACLVGLQYPQRNELVNRLRRNGKQVFYDNGQILDEYRTIYNQSKVALNWSSLQDLPVRVFEAMGMKRPLVTNRVPDLLRLFKEGVHFLGFDNLDEAESQVNYLLANPDYAKEMAETAYNEVMTKHTWKHRIDEMLKVING